MNLLCKFYTIHKTLLFSGKKAGKTLEIINAFKGENAKAMYELLTTKQ